MHDIAPMHDGRLGLATMEVCFAILQSAREGRDGRTETSSADAVGVRLRKPGAGLMVEKRARSQVAQELLTRWREAVPMTGLRI